ncbi:MAG TPA: hypothetical protein VF306_09145 [Pirellulales bacterium]
MLVLRRSVLSFVGLSCCLAGEVVWAQSYGQRQPGYGQGQRGAGRRTVARRTDFSRNELPARNTQTVINEVIRPIPLTENRLDAAVSGVARQIRDLVDDMRPAMRRVFPDKLEALAGTSGWEPEDRTALTKALRSGDPAAIYEAWLQAQPNDTSGAEQIAREAEVQRAFNKLEQGAEEGELTLDEVDDLGAALDKLAAVVPAAADLTGDVDTLATWVEIQEILLDAEPDVGAPRQLPTGRVKLIHNPNLRFGSAVVLSDDTVMVGCRGRGGVDISRGNAAEALGLPVLSEDSVPEAEGAPMRSGTMLVNPKRSGANVRYVLNGEEYLMKPGSSQRLPAGQRWVIEFDRGGRQGGTEYTLADGTYYFEPTDRGWELYHERFDVTVDNSRNPRDFHFVFNGEPLAVRGGHTRSISSRYPIVVEYDRGNGTEMVRKALNFAGNVEVAINAEDNLWDLFPEEENRRQEREVELFH